MKLLSGIITILFGLYLISLLIITLVKKQWVINYLSSFAGSAKAHYLEQLLRLIVGLALLVYSGEMLFPDAFRLFGWVIIVTTILLLIMPWKWHNRFGKWAIPFVTRNLSLYAVSAAIMGLVMLYCVIAPLI